MRIGYVRTSSRDQNPELQLQALAKVADQVVEEKASGKHGSARPVWRELLAQLQPGDTLIVWKLDRAGRSVIDLHETLRDLDARGITFRTITGNIDTSTSQGRLFFTLLAAFAEFERELIVERSTAGKRARVALGKHPGGPRMFGFAADHETVIESEASWLREGAAFVLNGGRVGQLAGMWQAANVPTVRGAEWSDAAVRSLLLNPRSAALVGDNVYEQLVSLLKRNGQDRRGRPPSALLTGLVYCRCGAPMYVWNVANHRASYVCRAPYAGRGFKGCGNVSISRNGLESLIVGAFFNIVCGPTFEERRRLRLKELVGDTVDATVIDAWRDELEELEPILDTRFAEQKHRDLYDELSAKIAEATRRLLAQPDADTLASLPNARDKLEAEWDGWTDDERRCALSVILEHVTVFPASLGKRQGPRLDDKRVKPKWRF